MKHSVPLYRAVVFRAPMSRLAGIAAAVAWAVAASVLAADGPGVRFETDGRAVLENDLIVLKADNRSGGWSSGIRSWLFKPTGFEMVDVLFGQTDYVPGHVLGEVWDDVTLGLDIPAGRPAHGTLYVPEGVGASADKRVVALRQITRDRYSLQREIILRRDLAVVEVRYRLTNLDAPPVGMSFRLHSSLSPGARGRYQSKAETLFIPVTNGVLALDQSLNNEQFQNAYGGDDKFFNSHRADEPGRSWVNPKSLKTPLLAGNWAAWINRTHGDGLVFIADAERLLGFYNCPGSSLEPVLRSISLKPGESFATQVYVGAFTGLAGTAPVGATPLTVVTQPLALEGGRLRGALLPLWRGKLRIVDAGGKTQFEAAAEPTTAVAINAAGAGAGWRLVALDRVGVEIGSVDAAGRVVFSTPEIVFPEIRKPAVAGNVYRDAGQDEAIRAFLEPRDFTVFCAFGASEAEKTEARDLARQLGVGLSWTPPGGKLLVVGEPAVNPLVRDAGLLKQSVDAAWPGPGRGAVLHYPNFEVTQKPLLLIAGSDAAGAARAAVAFSSVFLDEAEPPKGYDFWVAGTDLKVYPYTRPAGNRTGDCVRLRAARGEDEPAQLVITAYDAQEDLAVDVAPLVHAATGKEIAKRFETVHRRRIGPLWLRWVNYWPIARADSRQQGWTGQPDPLLERPETKLSAGVSQALWLTVLVPEGADAGSYRSTITCRAGAVTSAIPIEVEVLDFTLPRDGLGGEPYMSLASMPPEGKANPAEPSDGALESRHIEALVRNFTAHGIRKIHLGPDGMFRWYFSPEGAFKGVEVPWLTVSEDGCVMLDAGYFDQLVGMIDKSGEPFAMSYMLYAQAVLSRGDGANSGYGEFRRALPKRFADRPKREGHMFNSYEVEEMLTLLRRHLEKRGWLDRVILKIGDEPLGFDYWWERFTLAARNAGMPITTAFNSIDWAEAVKGIGIVKEWTPLYLNYNADFFAKARAGGDKIAWYNCGPPPRITTGASASELRAYIWQAAKADLDFVTWWGIQNWNYYSHESLWLDRYSHSNSVLYPEHPDKPRWLKAGRGWVDTTPLDSIRWELIRDGMEDAWYVNLLRRRIAAAREKGLTEAADRAQAVLETIWRDVFPTLNNYNPPYAEILAARERVGQAILDLQAAGAGTGQTNR
jgi:hypothetical protein